MYRTFVLFIVSSLLFISCKKGNDLVGNWEFVSGSHHSSDNYHSYILFSDNGHFLFTKNSLSDTLGNSISFGKWKEPKDDSVIILNFDYPKSKMILKNVSNDGRNLGFINENSEEFYYKKSDYSEVSKSDYNFITSELNTWRIPATQPETKEKIYNRIENGLQFSINFLKYHREKESTAPVAFLTILPFRFASNGIAFKPENAEWNALFFNEQDLNYANELLLKSFKSTASIPYDKKTPIDINIYILEETLKNLKRNKNTL